MTVNLINVTEITFVLVFKKFKETQIRCYIKNGIFSYFKK